MTKEFSSPSGGDQFISKKLIKLKLDKVVVFVSFWRRSVHIRNKAIKINQIYHLSFRLLLAEISSYQQFKLDQETMDQVFVSFWRRSVHILVSYS